MPNIRQRSSSQMIAEEGGLKTNAEVIGPDAKWGYTRVRLPSGKEGRIPTEKVDAFVAHYKPRHVGAKDHAEQGAAFVSGMERGASLDFADELEGLDAARASMRNKPGFGAGLKSGLIEAIPTDTLSGMAARYVDDDADAAYKGARDMKRREQDATESKSRLGAGIGSVVGGAPTMMITTGPATTIREAIAAVAPSVATGVASGMGAAKESKDMAGAGARGAILPAIFGLGGQALARVFPQRAAEKAAKAVDDLVPENVAATADDFAAKSRVAELRNAKAGLEGIDDVGGEIDSLKHSAEIAKKAKDIAEERASIVTAPPRPRRQPVSDIAEDIRLEDDLAGLPGAKAPKSVRTGAERPKAKAKAEPSFMGGAGAKIEEVSPLVSKTEEAGAPLARPSWWRSEEWFPKSVSTPQGEKLLRVRASAEIDRLPEAARGAAKNEIERMIVAARGGAEKTKVAPELAGTRVKATPEPDASAYGPRPIDDKGRAAYARYQAQAAEAGDDMAAATEQAGKLSGLRDRLTAAQAAAPTEEAAARAAGRYGASEAKLNPAMAKLEKLQGRVKTYDKYAPTVARVAARGAAGAAGAASFGGGGAVTGIGAAALWSLSNHPKIAAKVMARVGNLAEAGMEGAGKLTQNVVPSYEASLRDPSFIEKALAEIERDPELRAEVEQVSAPKAPASKPRKIEGLRERRASASQLLGL